MYGLSAPKICARVIVWENSLIPKWSLHPRSGKTRYTVDTIVNSIAIIKDRVIFICNTIIYLLKNQVFKISDNVKFVTVLFFLQNLLK